MDLAPYGHVLRVQDILLNKFPYFAKVIEKRHAEFGEEWLKSFDQELKVFFSNDPDSLFKAVMGYGRFALDGMKLQKKFDKAGEYVHKRYDEVAQAVYLDREYMMGLYLPGIYLSNYLWPHHYRQLEYFRQEFVPMAVESRAQVFFDVGVGTGFYSKEMLMGYPLIKGNGLDISPFSIEHASCMVGRWNFQDRYELKKRDILANPPDRQADVLINVEVLEHLENPLAFLKGLNALLRPGGLGFITAAITAPNADHIYLYRNLDQLRAQIQDADFQIIKSTQYAGFDPKPGESVPINGICVVTKGA